MSTQPQTNDQALASVSGGSDHCQRWRCWGFLTLVSIVAFCLGVFFFAPRFAYWKGLGVAGLPSNTPEVNRANVVLLQLENPFLKIQDPGNKVVAWRLFFPLVGHYLHLPRNVFLALAHVGCLLVLGLAAHIGWRETRSRIFAAMIAALLATTTWFFVSTGWLAYYDSWYVLGVLLVAFSSNRIVLITACVLTPWIDERFVLSLPLCLVVRAGALARHSQIHWRQWLTDCLWVVVLTLPYLATRIGLMATGQDSTSTAHVRDHIATIYVNPLQMAKSIWSGLRSVWIFVVMWGYYCFVNKRWWWGGLCMATTLCCTGIVLSLAGDTGRNMAILIPSALLGMVFLCRSTPERMAGYILGGALAFNLFTPAIHGFNFWELPVRYLYAEVDRYQNPPEIVNVDAYNRLALTLFQAGDLRGALTSLDTALALDPKSYVSLFNRGIIRSRLGDITGARADLLEAIRISPTTWPPRTQAEQMLKSPQSSLLFDISPN